MVVGDKRKFLSALLTIKTMIDVEGTPTNQLTPEAIEVLQEQNISATTLGELLRDRSKVTAYIKAGVDKVNARATSEIQKIVKFDILPVDFSVSGGELGPTFRLQRLIVAKKVSPQP